MTSNMRIMREFLKLLGRQLLLTTSQAKNIINKHFDSSLSIFNLKNKSK